MGLPDGTQQWIMDHVVGILVELCYFFDAVLIVVALKPHRLSIFEDPAFLRNSDPSVDVDGGRRKKNERRRIGSLAHQKRGIFEDFYLHGHLCVLKVGKRRLGIHGLALMGAAGQTAPNRIVLLLTRRLVFVAPLASRKMRAKRREAQWQNLAARQAEIGRGTGDADVHEAVE
jgi:hypothetical protein